MHSSLNNDIELSTLPRPGRRKPDSSKTGVDQVHSKHNMATPKKPGDKKGGFFNGFFGGTSRGNSKGGAQSKYDYVRGVEAINYTKKSDDELEKSPQKYQALKTQHVKSHRFELHYKPTWCDICQDFILGLNAQSARCLYCKYTCHVKCVKDVTLECPKAPSAEKSFEELTKEVQEILNDKDGSEKKVCKNNNLPSFVSSLSELRKLIDTFNNDSPVIMTLHEDGAFDGFIRVHMNLTRPVNVSTDVQNLTLKRARKRLSESRRPLSELFKPDANYDSGIGSESSACSTLTSVDSVNFNTRARRRPSRRLSFYLPKETFKPLHVTSTTTAREVISALLAKYNVTDNPQKFALYEKTTNKITNKESEVKYRRLNDDEKPLILRLDWGAKTSNKSFALKEDDDGPVQWMNFEIPELNNFLNILQIEEDALLAQIYQKYEKYRETLRKAIEAKDGAIK